MGLPFGSKARVECGIGLKLLTFRPEDLTRQEVGTCIQRGSVTVHGVSTVCSGLGSRPRRPEIGLPRFAPGNIALAEFVLYISTRIFPSAKVAVDFL